MAIRQINWQLDTCDCWLLLSYDDTTPPDTREFTLVNWVRTCGFHDSISDLTQRRSTITEENSRKNQAIQIILDHAPASMLQTMSDGTVRLKKRIDIRFTVAGTAPNRTFTIIVSGVTLTQNQINTAQNFLDNRFGVGKVTLVNQP